MIKLLIFTQVVLVGFFGLFLTTILLVLSISSLPIGEIIYLLSLVIPLNLATLFGWAMLCRPTVKLKIIWLVCVVIVSIQAIYLLALIQIAEAFEPVLFTCQLVFLLYSVFAYYYTLGLKKASEVNKKLSVALTIVKLPLPFYYNG